jgi:hypothetical protein
MWFSQNERHSFQALHHVLGVGGDVHVSFFKHHGGSIHEATPKWMLYDENDPSKVKMDDLRLSPHLQKPDETMISHVFLCTLW